MHTASGHLTYCTNVHPGETWSEVHQAMTRYAVQVKTQLCPDRPFGLGLRLSADAASSLQSPQAQQVLQAWLAEHGMYVFTINGFPYGSFHGTRVKEAVYLPDWRANARRQYTEQLAHLLIHLLPPGLEGSISTVPGGFKPAVDTAARAQMAEQLLALVATLHDIERTTGRVIRIALEPEPCCMLETIDEAIEFFEASLLEREGLVRLSQATGCLPLARAEALVRRHLGLCLDTCHAAVEFEDARSCITRLRGAGIRIAKLQLSSGLRIERLAPAAVDALVAYQDDVYLHQVVERSARGIRRYLDLPEALASLRAEPAFIEREWRVHFHVPVFQDQLGPFASTQNFLQEILAIQRVAPFTEHLEVETYTWNVLPSELRSSCVTDDIVRELRWSQSMLEDGSGNA